jgi:CRISPR-associated protein Csh1
MIREIIEFTKEVESEIGEDDNQLEEGFHAVIELDEQGNLKDYFSYVHRKGLVLYPDYEAKLNEIAKVEKISKSLGNNKGINDKKIFSNNFYTLYFKLFFTTNETDKNLIKKIKSDFVNYKHDLNEVTISNFILIEDKFNKIFPKDMKESKIEIRDYFEKIKKEYYSAEKILTIKLGKKGYLKYLKEAFLKNDYLKKQITLRKELKRIKMYCLNKLKNQLLGDNNFFQKLIIKENKSRKQELSSDLLDTEIRITFSLDYLSIKEAAGNYINHKLPLKDIYNIPYEGQMYSIPDFFNGVNDKKPFLKHKTASFQMNSRYTLDDLKYLFSFEIFQREKKFPNPIPIFIDKKEILNKEMVQIFRKDGKLKFSEVIKQLFKEHKEDIGNYYLLFILGGEIKDFDFVSRFRYETDFEVKNIFEVYESKDKLKKNRKITDIFEFERDIIQKIFNNSLVQISKKQEISMKYFEEIKKEYCDDNSSIIYQNVLKYRKAIYDFIYKSKTQSITGIMFYDIMISGILNDITKDKRDANKRDRTFDIREKLNIWFSLNQHFDKENKNFGGIEDMPSRITEQLEKIKRVANDENAHIETDEEFAFSSGQLIYWLLSKNESSNKTHALLEPFLQKHDPKLFIGAIATTFERYKHAFPLYPSKYPFDIIMSEVMSYETEEKNIKNLLPFILAGYFAKSIFSKEQ